MKKALLFLLALNVYAVAVQWILTGCGGGGGGSGKVAEADSPALLARVAALEREMTQAQNSLQTMKGLTAEQAEILSHLSIAYLDNGQGALAKTIRITGVNVQIVNGLGATNGNPSDPSPMVQGWINGTGNLIVGYQELTGGENIRTGSHNIVVGGFHNYGNTAGIVVGYGNSIYGTGSIVAGGGMNAAVGDFSTISGGFKNIAGGYASSISGGLENTTEGDWASISGGVQNKAVGVSSSVSAGFRNAAQGESSSVSGGIDNTANGEFSSVSAGFQNTASGDTSSVTGGFQNTAAGGSSSVSGGTGRIVKGDFDWAAGALFQTASKE